MRVRLADHDCRLNVIFIPRRIIGIPSTGSAGLIQTIQMYAQGHWAAGILGTIATVGWTVQGLGNAFYYRQVRDSVHHLRSSCITRTLDMESPYGCWSQRGQGDILS